MKKILATLLLGLSLFTASTQKSHAVVGLVLGNPIVASVGGLASLGGFVMIHNRNSDLATGLVIALNGIVVAAVGVTLLEDGQTAEVRFSEISSHAKFNQAELVTYNSEIEELNAINQTITAQLKANPRANAKALWNDLGSVLSPATVKVASSVSYDLMKALK